jgi:tRNA U34 5-carboxymethylaminomethyl modifying GTPase MnmE/TrmE
MSHSAPDAVNRDLIEHLTRQTNLSSAAAKNLVVEVLAYYRETPESFVRRRHLELRQQGHGNSAIYSTIKTEIEQRLFAAEPHSERQIRRIIYG